MSFAFAFPARRRRPSLTPMIDVVFLLLVFFMLVSRFGAEGALQVAAPGGGTAWQGPPRLVEVGQGRLWLNGAERAPDTLLAELAGLVALPEDPVVLRPRDGATLQDLVSAMELLRAGGFSQLYLVE